MIKDDYVKKNSDYDKIAGLYNIGSTIGRGHYAVVKEAKHVFTEEKVAIKVIDKTKLDFQSREHLFSEVMCMKLVQHPNVVRLYEVIDTANKLYLVLELGDAGDLYDYIMKHENGLPEQQARRYFRQIVQAIAYCHNLHVVHRDLKPENVVFFEKLELVKLTDFGFSNKFVPGGLLETSCGSLAYSAPEVLLGDAYDGPKIDIWSLGVILYMLVCGKLPFDEPNDSETLSKIMDCRFNLPGKVSSSCGNLIAMMLVRLPEERATLEEILGHEWVGGESLEAFSVPLFSQQQLSVEEHVDILTKMSEGNLASVEDIQVTLDRQEYSYITATYFLLAERKLKRRQYENFNRMKLLEIDNLEDEINKIPNTIDSETISTTAEGNSEENRARRFSMIVEDEEIEEEEEKEALISLASVREELSVIADLTIDCRSKIYQSQSLTSIIDYRKSIKLRHRQSLPTTIKRRMFYSFYNLSPNHSNSDNESDTESILFLRGSFNEKKRGAVADFVKSQGKHKKYNNRRQMTPDWWNSNSSLESEGSRHCYHHNHSTRSRHHRHRRQLRIKTSHSRPSSMGATMINMLSSLSDDDDGGGVLRQIQLSLSNSPTVGTLTTALHRDICAPIHEEDDELIGRSRSYIDKESIVNIDNVSIDCRRNSESNESKWSQFAPPQSQNRYQHIKKLHKIDSMSLSSQLTQSNFSLSSFASSLRDSKAMMNVIRGAFELQCLANKRRQNEADGNPRNVSSSANVSGRQSRCEFSSLSSLPLVSQIKNNLTHQSPFSSPPPFSPLSSSCPPPPLPPVVVVLHRNSQESLLVNNSNNVAIKTSSPIHGGVLMRTSTTVGRKARFILSCCRTS